MKRRWTAEEDAYMRERYPHDPTKSVASALNRTERAVYMRADHLGLRKTEKALSEHGARFMGLEGMDCRFRKGQTPWNKGKHHSPAGSEKGRFKKGNKPQTWQPIGAERVTKDGILERKVADTRDKKTDWKPVQVLVWEKHNGPLPEGKFIRFINGDKRDFRIENLMLVTRAENMRLNAYWNNYPPELARLIQLRGALNRQINRRRSHEKQN